MALAQTEPAPPPRPNDSRPTIEDQLKHRRAEEIAAAEAAARNRPPEARWEQGPGPDREPNEDDVRAAEQAMRKLAPNWWKRLDKVPQDAPWRPRMMRGAVERYRELQRTERRDPEQYKLDIRQLELEDEILGLAPRVWHDKAGGGQNIEELKSQLHEKVAQLTEVRIRSREARLKRLTETLAAEQKRLETEKRDRDKTVQKHFEAVLNRRPAPVFPGGPGNPGRPLRNQRNGPEGGDVFAVPPPPPGKAGLIDARRLKNSRLIAHRRALRKIVESRPSSQRNNLY
jgi:DNA repair exonuclease SbcCD ATPase subunit